MTTLLPKNVILDGAVVTSGTGTIAAGLRSVAFKCLSGTVTLTYQGRNIPLAADETTAVKSVAYEEEDRRYDAFSYNASNGTFQWEGTR